MTLTPSDRDVDAWGRVLVAGEADGFVDAAENGNAPFFKDYLLALKGNGDNPGCLVAVSPADNSRNSLIPGDEGKNIPIHIHDAGNQNGTGKTSRVRGGGRYGNRNLHTILIGDDQGRGWGGEGGGGGDGEVKGLKWICATGLGFGPGPLLFGIEGVNQLDIYCRVGKEIRGLGQSGCCGGCQGEQGHP